MPVEADGEAATVEQHGEDGSALLPLVVFEVGEEVSAYLPAVAPALDVRRGKGFAKQGGDAQDNGAPVFPGDFVVGLELRNAFGRVFFQLRELEAGAVKKVATVRG